MAKAQPEKLEAHSPLATTTRTVRAAGSHASGGKDGIRSRPVANFQSRTATASSAVIRPTVIGPTPRDSPKGTRTRTYSRPRSVRKLSASATTATAATRIRYDHPTPAPTTTATAAATATVRVTLEFRCLPGTSADVPCSRSPGDDDVPCDDVTLIRPPLDQRLRYPGEHGRTVVVHP